MQPASSHENSSARELDWLAGKTFVSTTALGSVFWTFESVVMRVPELEGFPVWQNSRQSTVFFECVVLVC